ncbi:hypothetical protein SAMN02745121_03497 [Nannocystis exedens]|uniref:Uncharacterized protein n=1 Tax=Nannocystis exedens TaxID=54 RepID=A0A1I1YTB2_9BACT|nr:hypothetical protein [Nannocystis exedens]PCC70182.1 hypothetical protein NAEX_03215 [Nannocystis exedens]SFE22228.1 hypothetical protein SAMN02745121_03497 [Nannocystis exedens]
MQARSLLLVVLAACGPRPPDDGATVGDPSSGSTTTTDPAPTTGSSTTTTGPAPTTGTTDDSGDAASVDPTIGKLDLPPSPDEPPPPPACDPLPDVPPEAHCEILQHDRGWKFFYACLEGADPDACPDATAAAVVDLLDDCSLCESVGGDAMCGPDPRRQDACCYWSFDLVSICPP